MILHRLRYMDGFPVHVCTGRGAMAIGLPGHRRILMGEELLAVLRPAEAYAVMAHEAGHLNKHHGAWMAFSSMALLLLFLWVGVHFDAPFFAGFGFCFIARPLLNVLSHRFEYAADRYAASVAGAEHLKTALRKIKSMRRSNDCHSHRILIRSHPSLLKRMKRLYSEGG